jgi:hypothetical protein
MQKHGLGGIGGIGGKLSCELVATSEAVDRNDASHYLPSPPMTLDPVLEVNVRLGLLMSGCSVLRVRSSARCPRGQFPLCGPQHRRGPIGVAL